MKSHTQPLTLTYSAVHTAFYRDLFEEPWQMVVFMSVLCPFFVFLSLRSFEAVIVQ